jgi:NADPH2:quinone reductase
VLFHAAAGGVGLIACQWAKALGLQLIGTAGSDAKCKLRQGIRRGACHQLQHRDFAARVKEITGGKGVKVVYDSVGKDTFDKSLDCLRPFGLLASFGNAARARCRRSRPASWPPRARSTSRGPRCSRTWPRAKHAGHGRRPVCGGHQRQGEDPIDQRYPAGQVQQAHRDLEARKTTGCTILTL